MRIEAANLQEAFQKAADELHCSVTELDIKVIQHPSSGFLGFFKKSAIIEANIEKKGEFSKKDRFERDDKKRHDKFKKDDRSEKTDDKRAEKPQKNEQKQEHREEAERKNFKDERDDKKRDDKRDEKRENRREDRKNRNKKKKQAEPKQTLSEKNENLAQNAFGENAVATDESKPEFIIKRLDEPVVLHKHESKNILDTSIIDNFNVEISSEEPNKKLPEKEEKKPKEPINFDEILPTIKADLTKLLDASCFNITKIDVSKFNDECVLVELDGEDAALLIGKEGYRYKAISYLLHNWLNSKYNLLVRLEIAEFLKNQEAMIEQYLSSVIERIEANGKAQTKPLDGVLVKIALEKLRERFPEKYVGIKSNGNEKFVVVNEFFKK